MKTGKKLAHEMQLKQGSGIFGGKLRGDKGKVGI